MTSNLRSQNATSKKSGRKGARRPLPEGWKLARKSRRLADGRLRKDYPCEIVINLSEKQMAYAQWVTDQLYGVPEYMAYTAVIDKITSWWKVMPEDVKQRITNMD